MKKFNYLLPLLKRLFGRGRGRPFGSKDRKKRKRRRKND